MPAVDFASIECRKFWGDLAKLRSPSLRLSKADPHLLRVLVESKNLVQIGETIKTQALVGIRVCEFDDLVES